jgi:hypothetical protein
MATLFQTLENTPAAMKTLHSAATCWLGAAQRGTVQRGWDSIDILQCALYVAMVVFVACVALLVWAHFATRHDRRAMAIIQSNPVQWYAQPAPTVRDAVQPIESSIYPVIVSEPNTLNIRKGK